MALPTSGQITLEQIHEEAVDGGFPIKGSNLGSGLTLSRNDDINLKDLSEWKGWKANSPYTPVGASAPFEMHEFYGNYVEDHLNVAFSDEQFSSVTGKNTNFGVAGIQSTCQATSSRYLTVWAEASAGIFGRTFTINSSTGEMTMSGTEKIIDSSGFLLVNADGTGPSVSSLDIGDGVCIVAFGVPSSAPEKHDHYLYALQVDNFSGSITVKATRQLTVTGDGWATKAYVTKARNKFTNGSGVDYYQFISIDDRIRLCSVTELSGSWAVAEHDTTKLWSNQTVAQTRAMFVRNNPYNNFTFWDVRIGWQNANASFWGEVPVGSSNFTNWSPAWGWITATGGNSTNHDDTLSVTRYNPKQDDVENTSGTDIVSNTGFQAEWNKYVPDSLRTGRGFIDGGANPDFHGVCLVNYDASNYNGPGDLRVVCWNERFVNNQYTATPPDIRATQSISWLESIVTGRYDIEIVDIVSTRVYFVVAGVDDPSNEIRMGLYCWYWSGSTLWQCGDYLTIKTSVDDNSQVELYCPETTFGGNHMVYCKYQSDGVDGDGYFIQVKVTSNLSNLYY